MQSEPLRVAVRWQGGTHVYVLRARQAEVYGGAELTIHAFIKEDEPATGPAAFEISETSRGRLPVEELALVAQALVQRLGLTARRASEVTGQLQGEVEELGIVDTQTAIDRIKVALDTLPKV